MLCTRNDIKDRKGISATDTDHDDVIDQIILGFLSRAESYTARTLIVTAADVTEFLTGGTEYIQLTRYPVVDITSIKIAYDFDFDSADALTANTDYRVLRGGNKGVILRCVGIWPMAHESIQALYRGSYCAAGVTPSAGEVALPDDLREAAIIQCSFLFNRKDDIGLAGVSFAGGGFSKFEAVKLLPEVESILKSYRRITL